MIMISPGLLVSGQRVKPRPRVAEPGTMEEDGKEYRWETGYEKTWESITEDGDGMLDVSVQEVIHKARRKRLAERQSKAKLGMMRHLYLLIGDG